MSQITELDELRRYVEEEFARLAGALGEQISVELRPVFREPTKPREGMLVFADGTSWNPGAGAGTYEYRGAAWHKL